MQEITTFILNHSALSAAVALVIFLVLILELLKLKRKTYTLSPAQTTQMINRENAQIIDIRPADVFRKSHIIDACPITPEEIRALSKKIEKLKAKPLIIVCNSGQESQKIAAFLLKRGYNAFALAGGIRAWFDAQLPMVKK